MIDFKNDFETNEVIVDGRKTLETMGFVKAFDPSDINGDISGKQSKPYFKMFSKNKKDIKIELHRDIKTRRCVLSFHNDILNSDDPNCMLSVQFLHRLDVLNAIVCARSIDIKKLDDDLSTIKFMLKTLCNEIGENPGMIIFFSGSFHEYI